MGVGWEVDEYGFAWMHVAPLTPGGCTLGLSHCSFAKLGQVELIFSIHAAFDFNGAFLPVPSLL